MEVYQNFGKTEQSVEQDVEIIRNWIRSQPHLPEIMEDVKIRNFLVLNKFSIEKTKDKIDMYYTIRSAIPDLFENCNPKLPNMVAIHDYVYESTLPTLVDGLYRVYFSKIKVANCFNPLDTCRMWFNMFEVKLYEESAVSDIVVYDMSTTTLGDMTKITPTLLTKFFAIYKKVYALRLRKLILINSPSYATVLVNMLKMVMKPKIFERIEVHQGEEILKEYFSKDILPKDYGGNGPSLDELNEMMSQKFVQYRDRFDTLDTLKVDESLRPEKLDNDEILGFYGSFKKLDVD